MVEEKKWLIPVLIAAFVILAAVVAVVILTVVKKSSASKKGAEAAVPVTVGNGPGQNSAPDILGSSDCAVISSTISASAAYFSGLYEGTYMAAYVPGNVDPDVFSEWLIRVRNLEGNEQFRALFLQKLDFSTDVQNPLYLAQVKALMKCIELSDVERSCEKEHITDAGTAKKYIFLDGAAPEKATPCKVIKPYWYQGSTVLEQGYLTKER